MLLTTCLSALTAAPLVTPAPTVPAASLPAPAPIVEAERVKFEEVEFATEDKLKIHARFYAPRKKGRAPAALLVHDAGSDAASMDSAAENLQRKGFAVLSIDLRGHGGSTSEELDWSKTGDETAQRQLWAYALRDLEAATAYLRDLDNVHSSNLSLVGMGAGGVLAARHATKDPNARAVALITPKPEIYGYNMMPDVVALGGLPVQMLVTSEERADATRIASAAAKASDGFEYVDVQVIKPKSASDVFSDKRVNTELAKFLREEAMDKR